MLKYIYALGSVQWRLKLSSTIKTSTSTPSTKSVSTNLCPAQSWVLSRSKCLGSLTNVKFLRCFKVTPLGIIQRSTATEQIRSYTGTDHQDLQLTIPLNIIPELKLTVQYCQHPLSDVAGPPALFFSAHQPPLPVLVVLHRKCQIYNFTESA